MDDNAGRIIPPDPDPLYTDVETPVSTKALDDDLQRVRIASRRENWYAWQKARDSERRRAQAIGCLFIVVASIILWSLILWMVSMAYDLVSGLVGG
jgi:hypothetical protein